jgi:hypothetical protein
MNSKLIRNALTMCLMVAMIATYSMVALANDGKTAGEIVITGNNSNGVVTVNGEVAKSGRTIFSSSTITTPEGSGAIVNLGKTRRLELAPNTTFALSFDDNSVSGNLTAGSITVLSAAHSVGVKTSNGELVQVNAGETVSASSASASKQTTKSTSSMDWGWWALIVGGAVAAIVIAAADGNENRFGQNAQTVSPVR